MSIRALIFAAITIVPACTIYDTPPPSISAADITAILDAQAEAWNAGDLDAFMDGYWRSEELTFVGASGLVRGFDATLARYRSSYPDAAARGTLRFELVEVRPVSHGAAFVIGRYYLERAEPNDGWFTLVVERGPEGLRIVHDHSSSSGD